MHRLAMVVLLTRAASAQTLIDAARIPAAMQHTDTLHAGSLQCQIQPIKPILDFGFRFQAGFVIRIPLSQYSGPGHSWAVLLTVTPEGGHPVYLGERIDLPPVPPTKQVAEIGGGYLLGEGRYAVNEMLLDESGRSCQRDWRVEARLPLGERKVPVAVPPDTACDFALHGCPPARRDDTAPLRLTVLLNTPTPSQRRLGSGVHGRLRLLGMLTALMERMPAGPARLVVFSLDQQSVLLRDDHFTLEALPQVWRVFNDPKLSLVDYHVLQKPKGHLDFLAGLASREMDAPSLSDVVVFLGPPCRFFDKMPPALLGEPNGTAPRFFYLQYQPGISVVAPQSAMARPYAPDSITSTVSRLKGRSLVIHSPAELDKAIRLMERPTS